MGQTAYSDEQLVEGILQGNDQARKATLHYIYTSWRDNIVAVLIEWGARNAQAKEAIHAALAILDNNIRIRKYRGKSGLQNHLTQIAKREFIATASDEQLIKMIRKQDKARETVFRYIDENWTKSAQKILLSKGGNLADIENAVQNSMLIFERNICNGNYKPTSTLEAYFIGICKMQYRSGIQQHGKVDLTDNVFKLDQADNSNPETLMLDKELKAMVFKALKTMGKECRELLHLFSLHIPYKEIAAELGIRNEKSVAGKIFSCKDKLLKLINKTPEFKNFFQQQI